MVHWDPSPRAKSHSFTGNRVRGSGEQGVMGVAAGKVPAFGLLKRGGRVYTLPIPGAKTKTSVPILESRVVPDRIVYTDNGWLCQLRCDLRFYVPPPAYGSRQGFRCGKRSQASYGRYRELLEPGEATLEEAGGIPRKSFYYFLKERGWRTAAGTAGASSQATPPGGARREGLLK